MRTYTTSITIRAGRDAVLRLVADLDQLPRWAVGFARAVERSDGGHVVTTAGGEQLPIRVVVDERLGVVDWLVQPAPGVELPAHSRVLAAGDATLYTFTMLQAPNMPDEAFDRQVEALGHELGVLRSILEVACPA